MRISFALIILLAAALPFCSAERALAQEPPLAFADQGPNWTPETRSDFYSRDQGSKMIPLNWLRSLKQANGQPFLSDNLARYGYLANPANSNGLPIGFTASGLAGIQMVGMTCSACHTRQITAEGKSYRIDGGPAIADFQSLLSDLDVAVDNVMSSDAEFASFAAAVLGSPTPDPEDVSALRTDVDAWRQRYHMLISRALPKQPWGPARLDAVSMIFDRLTGLDLGPPTNLLIPDNILPADAPVRYPFLWSAPRQDETQWSGFADNGSDVLALGRNVGEVLGVFGVFEPKKDGLVINFLNNNSTNFDGLAKAEDLIKLIGPPKWPWPVDSNLVAQGKAIFERSTDQGGCHECHDMTPGKMRFLLQPTWATPVWNVGTDTRQYDILARNASTGALQGAFIPLVTAKPLNQTDLAINVLKISVVGSIAEHALNTGGGATEAAEAVANDAAPLALRPAKLIGRLPLALRDLQGTFHLPGEAAAAASARGAYEARVLQGVWAVAPYLHNGSVPTLAELLKPAAQRVKSFKVGAAYDTVNVGLAADQQQSDYELTTSDCSDLNSGNSRCGHEYGTSLSDAEKKALIEYLKTL
jgi:hypothetical protein